jgi:hypothetical protein
MNKRETSPDQPDEERPADKKLGYAQDAGHPGGGQDLDDKTETEGEHDAWERHG